MEDTLQDFDWIKFFDWWPARLCPRPDVWRRFQAVNGDDHRTLSA